MFGKQTYVDRRNALKEQLDSGIVLLLGNNESSRNFADNMYPFRQDSTFLYFFGLDQPQLAAVIDLDEGDEIIFGDELTIDHIVWMGDLPTVTERSAACGVADTRPVAHLPEVIGKATAAGRRIHFLPPYRHDNKLRLQELTGIKPAEAGAGASLELIRAVVALRSIKSDEEVAQIEEAVDVAVDMHTAGMRMARPGLVESEIVAEVERIASAHARGLSFAVIGTIHGAILHNHDHSNTMQSGDLFLLDAGAESPLGYAADLSSTFPVDPVFSERQKTIYEISLAAHQAAVDTLGPGVPNRDAHFAAARAIAEGMQGLGMMKGNIEEALVAGAHAMFFQCGVGHMMGLDVHDMEDLGEIHVGYEGKPKSTLFGLKSLRLARPLQPGFVLTVEPGVYFIPQLIDLWRAEKRFAEFLVYDEIDKWRDFGGIRNEEDYLITADGKRVLGKRKPMTIAEVEAVRSS